MSIMKKAVLLFSWGADSTTVLYKLIEEWYEVYPLIIYYGQRNEKEGTRATEILTDLEIWRKFLDCSEIMSICDSELLWPDDELYLWKQEDYTVHSRNLLFLSYWAMYAQNIKADVLSMWIHDWGFDYDCSFKFCDLMKEVLEICDARQVELYLPYLHIDKKGLIEDWIRMEVPYEKTRTCYNDDDVPCGMCPSCKARDEIFSKLAEEWKYIYPGLKH